MKRIVNVVYRASRTFDRNPSVLLPGNKACISLDSTVEYIVNCISVGVVDNVCIYVYPT